MESSRSTIYLYLDQLSDWASSWRSRPRVNAAQTAPYEDLVSPLANVASPIIADQPAEVSATV
jgi:hypothetical protein